MNPLKYPASRGILLFRMMRIRKKQSQTELFSAFVCDLWKTREDTFMISDIQEFAEKEDRIYLQAIILGVVLEQAQPLSGGFFWIPPEKRQKLNC